MEPFDEYLNPDDFLNLPNELLDASSFLKVDNIKSPDPPQPIAEILTQTVCIPIESTQVIQTVITKDEENRPQPLKSIDSNSSSISTRPKRAAALAANTSICSMKRKNTSQIENESDKENIENNENKPKAKQVKRRKTTSKKSSPEIQDKSIDTSKTQVQNENLKSKENEIIVFLAERQSLSKQQQSDLIQNQVPSLQFSFDSEPECDLNNNGIDFKNQNDCSKLIDPDQSNPRLSDFVVNQSHIVTIETHNLNSNSATSLHTPVKIDKSAVYTVSDNLYYDDSNYEKDDLGFTITRLIEPDLEQHKTHLEYHLELEQEIPIDENNNYFVPDSSKENKEENFLFYEGVDLLSLDSGKSSDELVGYAFNVAKVLFSKQELLEGTFANIDGKTRSKNRTPFDNHRTQIIKEAVVKKFKYDTKNLDTVWKTIRAELNKKISHIKK